MVISHYGSLESPVFQANVTGPSDRLIIADCDDAVEALLGMRDLSLADKIFSWVSGTDSSLRRYQNKPSENEMQPLLLGIGDGKRFKLNVRDGSGIPWNARGVTTELLGVQ